MYRKQDGGIIHIKIAHMDRTLHLITNLRLLL